MAIKKKSVKKRTIEQKTSTGTAGKRRSKNGAAKPAARKYAEAASEMYRLRMILRENLLLKSLTQEEIDYFSHQLSLRYFSKGKTIFKEGEHGDYLFFVIQGKVEVRLENSHNQHVLGLYAEGALVGEMSIVDEYVRSATVSAIEDTEILILTKTKFDEIIKKKSKLGIKLLLGISRVISARLRNTMGRFFELA